MFVEVLNGFGKPIRLPATQVVVYHDDGTPISVAALYGGNQAARVAHAQDKDFNQTLISLGLNRQVECRTIAGPPPPKGATRLVL